MKMYFTSLLLPMLACLLSACSTVSSEYMKYYRLDLIPDSIASVVDFETKTRIVIDEIQLPRFLKQENMVIQLANNEIYTANYHRWAEPLNVAISKLLVLQLNARDERFRYETSAGKWNRGAPIHLRIEFSEFHSNFNQEAVVSGRLWFYGQNKDLKFDQSFKFTEPLAQEGYDQAVKALQYSADRLSNQITKAVRSVDWASE